MDAARAPRRGGWRADRRARTVRRTPPAASPAAETLAERAAAAGSSPDDPPVRVGDGKDGGARLLWGSGVALGAEEDAALVAAVRETCAGLGGFAPDADVTAALAAAGPGATLAHASAVRRYLRASPEVALSRRRFAELGGPKTYAPENGVGIQALSERWGLPPMDVVREVAPLRYKLLGSSSRLECSRFVEAFVVLRDAASKGQALHVGDDGSVLVEFTRAQKVPPKEKQMNVRDKRRLRSYQKLRVWVSAEDWAEFDWAAQNDMQGGVRVVNAYLDEEARLVDHLRSLDLQVITEDGLRERNEGIGIKSKDDWTSTPDLLFRRPLKTSSGRGRPVRWIDFKGFYLPYAVGGEGVERRLAQLEKTAEKNTHDWGAGAFVFLHGACEPVAREVERFAGCLDGRFLLRDGEV